jgi:hypothetical protein
MKKVLLLFVGYLLLPRASVLSQTLWPPSSPIDEIRGDTLVIKTQDQMLGEPNALYVVLSRDTMNVPAGRVYMLKAGGVYPLQNNPTTYANRTTVIVGSDPTPVVQNKNTLSMPPLIVGHVGTFGSNAGGITAGGNLIIRNCALAPTAEDGTEGWLFTVTNNAHIRIEFDNCIFEHTRWVFAALADPNCTVTFRNCYFVNMNGQPCRRNGGVFDCFTNQDTLIVENCTHVMAQGNLYGFRTYPFNRIIVNHNTFINCAGSLFMNLGYQSNVSLTNNIFVNCNLHPYFIPIESDEPDWVGPIGIVNAFVDSTDTVINTSKKFLLQGNLVYWDPSLADCDSILNANRVNGVATWKSQMIIMNSKTQMMFNDDGQYPYLVTDSWKNELPNFTDPKNLFTTQRENLKMFVIGAADDTGRVVLPDWRLFHTSQESYVYPDWPIPVDLSYSNATLLTGGLSGFSIGDLNWFPAQKAVWLAQRTEEYENIGAALNTGRLLTAVRESGSLPAEIKLQQNYPNPFNPSTAISYQLAAVSNVTLKVFDVLGREVRTLVNERQNAGVHSVIFDAVNLSSGVYFYRLETGNFYATKKLLLLK